MYQKYLGWYDGNPSNLNPLPPTEAGKKFVEYMGGAAAVIARARDDFKQGNYRWVAQLMNQVVFADPGNKDARALAADALENELIAGSVSPVEGDHRIRRRQRLGGLLNYYVRAA